MHKYIPVFLFLLSACKTAYADDPQYANDLEPIIYDAHIHYDWDVWESLPPDQAVQMLRDEGIERAIVSATPTEGAEMMYKAAPDVVIPFLRPYKDIRHRYLWFKDPTTPDYIRDHLKRVPYKGFGEFHVFGEEDTTTEVMVEIVNIAREQGLALHPHTDTTGIHNFLRLAPDIPVIWAHGGFGAPTSLLKELLNKHENFYVELSLRENMLDENGDLTPEWVELLTTYKDRFLVGMDTYKPSRWADLPEIAEESRDWLHQLPPDAAILIARGNVERLFLQTQ